MCVSINKCICTVTGPGFEGNTDLLIHSSCGDNLPIRACMFPCPFSRNENDDGDDRKRGKKTSLY